MNKKLIIGMLAILTGIVTFIGVTFMVLALTGSVSFLKNHIIITTDSYEKEYDGIGIDESRYSVSGKLYEGDQVSIEFYEMSLNVGSYTAYFEAKVYNQNGKDVTESYDIEKNYGTVTVLKRELTLRAKSKEEEYDGEELKASEYEIVEGKGTLAEGDELEVTLSGSITEIGEAKATLVYTIYSTKDGKRINVSSNYKVTTENGILTKSAIPLTIKSDGATFEYDGLEHQANTYTTPYLKENENDTDENHTEHLAIGDTIEFNPTTKVKNVGTFDNDFEVSILDSNGNDVTQNYAIEKEYGEISILRKEITITSETKEREYNDETYVAQVDSSYQLDGTLADGDYPKVTFTQVATTAGSYDNTFYSTIYDADGVNVSNNYVVNHVYGKIIINPRPLSLATNSYEKVYDGEVLENAGDLTIAAATPLLTGHTLIAQFGQGIVDVGEVANHAIVTIKNEAGNDVTRNYAITLDAGTLTIKKRTLVLRASSSQKAYDGKPIVSNSWNLVSGSLAKNQYLNVTVKPEFELVDVGTVTNIITFQIENAAGQILTNALANYEVTLLPGVLTIYEAQNKPVYLAPKDVYKQYVDESTTITPTEIVGFDHYQSLGYSIECVLEGSQTGLGASASRIIEESIRIKDSDGVDVTNQFQLNLFTGLLQIYEKEITIITDSIEEEYDGLDHMANHVTITGADDLEVVYNVIGSQKNVGTSMNEIQILGVYRDTDTHHDDNLMNQYYLHITLGTIKVTPKTITVNTPSATNSITNVDFVQAELDESDIIGLVSGHTFVQSSVILDYIGSKQNAITIIILDENNNDITYNYNITYNYGTLKLTN